MIPDKVELPQPVEDEIQKHLAAIDQVLTRRWMADRERQNVLGDVHSQFVEMLTSETDKEPTVEDARAVIARMDPPSSYAEGEEYQHVSERASSLTNLDPPELKLSSVPSTPAYSRPGGGWATMFTLFGIVLPAVTLLIELFSRFATNEFFDPIPTGWHVALVAFVPLSNAMMLYLLMGNRVSNPKVVSMASGLAIAIAGAYAMLFLPITPLAFVAIIFVGMGLLPLAPLFSLLCAVYARRRYARLTKEVTGRRIPSILYPLGLALVVLLLINVNQASTRYGLVLASAPDEATRQRGISWLRRFSSEKEILRACYYRPGRALDPISWAVELNNPVSAEEARTAFYRVTGKSFDSLPLPQGIFETRRNDRTAELERLPENRDDSVGFIDPRLSLAASRLDGVLDADGGFGYVEWTLTFSNKHDVQREARTEIALPHGGVVSRLTLWVNGEEREAAFSTRAHVKEAYERVVTRRQDPVIVTTNGNDRILVKCFPVPPGGQMKTRIGITFPLQLQSREAAMVVLPRFLDRNFAVADVTHSIWVDSKGGEFKAQHASLSVQPAEGGVARLVGNISDKDLSQQAAITLKRNPDVTETIGADTPGGEGRFVRQAIVDTNTTVPKHVVLVLDQSKTLEKFADTIASAVKALPDGMQVTLIRAADKPAAARTFVTSRKERETLAESIILGEYAGGQDNVVALREAWDLAIRAGDDAAIVWLHGPQPVQLVPSDELIQRIERTRKGPQLYELQLAPGKNLLVNELDRLYEVKSIGRTGNPGTDLQQLFASWKPGAQRLEFAREPLASNDGVTSPPAFSAHIARLWAFNRAMQWYHARSAKSMELANTLAIRYQLVTPGTGAVVLENQAQYTEAGLTPVNASTVPTIPEPEFYILLAIAAALLGGVYLRKRWNGYRRLA